MTKGGQFRLTLDTSIEGLAASIAQDGLLQNLVVTKGRGSRFRLVSGERRYRALKLLAERGTIATDHPVAVEIRKLGKDEKLRIAAIENIQRENLPPLDEAAALAALIRQGEGLDDLAAKTGLSVTTIRRRLVLNDLCGAAKDALADGRITLAQAEALTLGDHEAQANVLDDLARGGHYEYSAAAIRAHLLDDRPTVAMAIFPVERYTGTITTDLFADGETSYFDDAEQFLAMQKEAVAALANDFADKAAWVEVTDRYSIPAWQYEEAEEGEQGGVLINLTPSGRVEVREGLIRPEAVANDEDLAENPLAPKKERPAYSATLCRLIGWHKSAAVAELLLANARKAREVSVTRRLAAFRPHEALPSLSKLEDTGISMDATEMQLRLCAGWLGIEIADDAPLWSQFPGYPACERDLYEAVCALTDHQLEQVDTLLTAFSFGQESCDRLDTQDSFFNRVARDLNADMRNHWSPDRAFLEKRSRDQLLEIAQECGCTDLYGRGLLASYKKGELVGCLLRHFTLARSAAEPTDAQRKART
ncbi:ParB/RepB/Spo0J family partition protein [Salinarimonas rosea]|uniref:ParB/RepB/Spo0J family partition protein n=1 Tax=Salinarimonas rosea TaxID=552063 RepID=UPI000406AD51|nr:ParB/RepB/Spo0J family partition protein [Salinarimonas rosea]